MIPTGIRENCGQIPDLSDSSGVGILALGVLEAQQWVWGGGFSWNLVRVRAPLLTLQWDRSLWQGEGEV